jgi:hypothetical protein
MIIEMETDIDSFWWRLEIGWRLENEIDAYLAANAAWIFIPTFMLG